MRKEAAPAACRCAAGRAATPGLPAPTCPGASGRAAPGRAGPRRCANARWPPRRDHFGFVFQAFHVLPHLTVEQNVALPLLLRNLPIERAKSAVASVGLAGREDSLPRELSGGELQRVAIARALVGEPRLVLADEPTGNLDPENAKVVLELFRGETKKRGAAAILATHSEQAAAGCDRAYRLSAEGLLPVD